ncbi:MAG: alpha/beta hydrolase [Flavobacteriaceae bacterium]
MKTNMKILAIILAIVLGLLLLVVVVLLFYSPGKTEPFLDRNGKVLAGSISEKTFVNFGGIRQGMFIKGKNKRNPVLLYLHGGFPDYFLTKKYPTGLEDHFTVVWWEQRGSGLSYRADIPPESMTLEQMISDVKEVTNYLRKRFGQEKIFLMGRSGGTYIGMHVVAQSPELYHAYIGVAQMSNQLKSERLAYEYMLSQFRENGNKKMVRKLESAPVTISEGTSAAYLSIRDQAMHILGIGTMRDMNSIVTGLFIPSLACRDYTLPEKINMWRAKAESGVSVLWNRMLATDLAMDVPEIEVPVYFFHGTYDYTVSYFLAKDYFEKLKAPLKGFYTFERSAHSPLLEEPGRVKEIIEKDVLLGKTDLADIIN